MALQFIEIETGAQPTGSVIWLHGLGADGHDFEPIVPELVQQGERGLRFIFPHAPIRPVTINGGFAMRAWYDILALDRLSAEDERGIRASTVAVSELIQREKQRGIESGRVVLAGFSQGGAIALTTGLRYPHQIAGVMALSCYLPLASSFTAERTAANQETAVFLAHGTQDPVVDPRSGEETRRILEDAGYAVEWHAYPMPHSVCPQEIVDIAAWLRRVLP